MKRGDTLTKIARLRKGLTAADLAWLNNQSADRPLQIGQRIKVPHQQYLDEGKRARDNFLTLAHYSDATGGKLPPNVAHPPSMAVQIEAAGVHEVRANGYRFDIDTVARPRQISGDVRLEPELRSRSAEANAGKPDRRSTDDGGHYIAARFKGPREWFNHFAQDANFNRGAYRRLEDQWARTVRSGKRVFVDIVPSTAERRCDHTSFLSSGTLTATQILRNSKMKKRAAEMPIGKYEKLGPMFSDIGGEVAHVVGGNPDGTYLYAEAGDGWRGASVFKDEGETVRYYHPSSELMDVIHEAWLGEEPSKRWCVMEYEINGTKFDAKFKFPDEVKVESFNDGRREAALKRRYGDKPVIYPPPPLPYEK